MSDTYGLCNECYGIINAYTELTTSGVLLIKECSFHGVQESLIDPSPDFYQWVRDSPKLDMSKRTGMTAISTTNRCNVRCPGCYHLPDNSIDRSLESIVKESGTISKKMVGLMGAEPSVRDDLAKVIKTIKTTYDKDVLVYTNGIKLEYRQYVNDLAESGLDRIALSLHLPSYIGNKAFTSKIKALENIGMTNIALDHISFSLKTMEDMDGIIDVVLNLDYSRILNSYVRIRAPSAIGGKRNEPAHLSEMLKAFLESCVRKGLKASVVPFSNHMYAVMMKVEERLVMLVRWPVVQEIDLVECQNAPVKALFVPEIGETHILHHVLMVERIRSGGALPPPPPSNCPPEISGNIGVNIA